MRFPPEHCVNVLPLRSVPNKTHAVGREPPRDARVPSATHNARTEGHTMGRYLLLWLLGIPLPILLLIWVFGGLH